MVEQALQRDYISLIDHIDASQRAALISFHIKGIKKATDLVRTLSDSFGIMCRSGHMCAQPLVDSYHSSQAIRASRYI